MELVIGALIFAAGLASGLFVARQKQATVTTVRRVRPSFRNPMRPYEAKYERYKARDSDLYEPQRPKRGDS